MAITIPTASTTSPEIHGAAIEARGISKHYRRIQALRDVDLAIPAGSITALVGPNGAGKSTLIKAWMGFERPSSGQVVVAGVDPWRHRGGAIQRLGYVPQASSLYRDLTVDDHLALAATLRRGFDQSGAADRLERLDIPRRAKAGELSGGQQAQVGLAIALGTRAPVLLLDEPLASLDPLARREFLAVLVEAVRSTGSTALLSSHIVTDVEQACDRLVVLGGGQVRLHETIAEARIMHRISAVGSIPPGTNLVSAFPGEDGRPRTLLCLGSAPHGGGGGLEAPLTPEAPELPGLPQATLEEIVIGHLAAGRPVTGMVAA